MWHAYDAVIMPIWAEKTDWIQEDITSFWNKVDAIAIEEIDSSIRSNEDFVKSKELFQDIFNAVDDISQTQAIALNKANENAHYRAVQKKLDALVSLNEATNAAIRLDMIDSVKAEVTKNLSQAKVKESAMAQAIANLASGANSVRGKDVVGAEYSRAIASYKAGLSSKEHRVHNITAKLETEIAEICKPIEAMDAAGNVYETHPVL
jgi:predicted RNA-binding Zn ribbon-like protein